MLFNSVCPYFNQHCKPIYNITLCQSHHLWANLDLQHCHLIYKWMPVTGNQKQIIHNCDIIFLFYILLYISLKMREALVYILADCSFPEVNVKVCVHSSIVWLMQFKFHLLQKSTLLNQQIFCARNYDWWVTREYWRTSLLTSLNSNWKLLVFFQRQSFPCHTIFIVCHCDFMVSSFRWPRTAPPA